MTALVEARLIVGNYALFSRMASEFKNHLDPQTFYHTKRVEQEERYRKYQEMPSLEPNCSDSPGGLRDLQTILWIAQTGLKQLARPETARFHYATRKNRGWNAERNSCSA